MIELYQVIKDAHEELKAELHREAVEKYKQKLREKKSIWDRIFPYKLVLVKKRSVDVRPK